MWNATADRRPALIACCTGVADVMAALNYAREHDLLVAVRGGGHNVAGNAVCDGGLVIDLSSMRAVYVDPGTRTAHVQGGAMGGDMDHETQAFGLAMPSGIISTTGVGGLTLDGGFGWLSRQYGLAVDNLLSAEVVIAHGRFVTASEAEHADLFWGLRGGGGNFGVVTGFTFQLHPVGPEVLFGPTIYQLEDAPRVLRHYRDFVRGVPRACSVYADLLTALPLPFLPSDVHGTKILSLIQFYGGGREGRGSVAPDRSEHTATPLPMPSRRFLIRAQSLSDLLYEKGASNYWKPHNATELSDAVIDTLVEYAAALPTQQSDILVHQV